MVETSADPPRSRLSPSAAPVFALGAAVVVLGYLLVTVAASVPAAGRELLSDLLTVPAAASLAVAAGRRARTPSPWQRTWQGVALAGLSWTLAEGSYAVITHLLQWVAAPGLPDVFYLLAPVPLAVGLLRVPVGPVVPGARLRLLLSGLVVALGLFFVTWSVVLPAVTTRGTSMLGRVVFTAYPVLDAVLLTLAAVALVRAGPSTRGRLALLTLGVLCYFGADGAYNYLEALGRYASGSVLDVGWIAGYLLMALAALVREPDRPDGADRPAASADRGGTGPTSERWR